MFMKTFKEFLEEDFNSVYDLIAEEIDSGTPKKIKQPWDDFEHESLEEFGKYYNKNIRPHIDKTEEPFRDILRSTKIDGSKYTVGRKSIESLHDKVMNREKPLSSVPDVLRGAILTRNKDEARDIVAKLKDTADVAEHEYKKIGEYETGYGGAHHVVLNVNGVNAEIQIMPKKIWKVHHETHRIYKKYRSMENPESHPDYEDDHKNSRKMFARAQKAWQRDN